MRVDARWRSRSHLRRPSGLNGGDVALTWVVVPVPPRVPVYIHDAVVAVIVDGWSQRGCPSSTGTSLTVCGLVRPRDRSPEYICQQQNFSAATLHKFSAAATLSGTLDSSPVDHVFIAVWPAGAVAQAPARPSSRRARSY